MIDSGRLTRGIALARDVFEIDGHHIVLSSDGHNYYRTSTGECDCMDYYYRGTVCKHRVAVHLRLRRLGALMASKPEG